MKKLKEEATNDKDKEVEEEVGSDADEKEEEGDEKEESKPAANAMVVANPGVSDDVLRQAMMGILSHWMASAATAMQPGGTSSAAKSDIRGATCDHCGGRNHTTDNCWSKTRENNGRGGEVSKKGNWSGGRQHQPPYRQVRAVEGSFDEAAMRREESGDYICNALGMNEGQLMYVPITLNGAKLERCMIDTGAEVNVISANLALKSGLTYQPAYIKEIQGFNGAPTKVVGIATCTMEMAPSQQPKEEKFLVVESIPGGPIIGMPTLNRFGLILDCDTKEITDKASGNMVKCAVLKMPPKN